MPPAKNLANVLGGISFEEPFGFLATLVECYEFKRAHLVPRPVIKADYTHQQ